MVILVAILIIALVAAVAFAVMQRRQAGGVSGLQRPRTSPIGRRGTVARHDPMAAAVAEHAQAMDPADVVAAEQRLQAEARNVNARMQAGSSPAGHPGAYAGGQPGAYPAAPPMAPGHSAPVAPAATAAGAAPGAGFPTDPSLDNHFDPATGERIDGYGDPANDPRYDDPRYDGRLAADWVDPREDDRTR